MASTRLSRVDHDFDLERESKSDFTLLSRVDHYFGGLGARLSALRPRIALRQAGLQRFELRAHGFREAVAELGEVFLDLG